MPLVLMILGFLWWWPLGLLILGYLIARHRFGWWRRPIYVGNEPMSDWDCHMDRWDERWDRKMARMQEKMERVRDRMNATGAGAAGSPPPRAATARSTTIARRR